jgi:hypothetical protein
MGLGIEPRPRERNTQGNAIADHAAKNFLACIPQVNTQKHDAAMGTEPAFFNHAIKSSCVMLHHGVDR